MLHWELLNKKTMRKITEEAYVAFNNRKKFKKRNTEVIVDGGDVYLELYGHCIAKKDGDGFIDVTLAGHPTNTTIERLSPFITIRRMRGDVYIPHYSRHSGKTSLIHWDGKWTPLDVLKNGEHN